MGEEGTATERIFPSNFIFTPDNLWLELFLFVLQRCASLSKHEQTRSNQGRYKVCDPNYFG